MVGASTPAIALGCVIFLSSEKEFERYLQLPGALRSGYPAQCTLTVDAVGCLTLVERTTGRPAAKGPDGVVESVEGIEPELEEFALGDVKLLLQAQVDGFQPRAADVADAACAESVCGRIGNIACVEPLNVRGDVELRIVRH